MRKALAVAAVALSLLGTRVVADASTIFRASMTFDQEVPTLPAFEGTSGVATFVLNDAQTALSYDVTIFGSRMWTICPSPRRPSRQGC